ncbi:hypothetical protein Amsp01_012750 [Amycolatopsis sp. NBRC 101858]|uniref:hypothetical protein n=1 Tax=Amycolatopsis sp. NBRC 101858 TaxID=3032200 RepID=UPI0024A0F2B2|nr:hypothetical protein [Amycolatopsis sp. NBRC 101858]GLY35251.1 hypothetical protein Amsp01_012750 [Amycolatopsis sp. NBRC 101858]
MQIAALNRRAQQRYATFVNTLDMVAEVLAEVDKLIAKYDDHAMSDSWTIASKDDLKSFRTKAFDELDRLRLLGKKHEAELISRDWRF